MSSIYIPISCVLRIRIIACHNVWWSCKDVSRSSLVSQKSAHTLNRVSTDEGLSMEDALTSKQAIMIPQAGAIFATRGTIPAKRAEGPSVRSIRNRRGIVEEMRVADGDIMRA